MARDPKPAVTAPKSNPGRKRTSGVPTLTASKLKTVVLLIHGMGEQRPMATLWSFVEAAWRTDRLFGDIVSGPVAPLFGPGIRDVKLRIAAPRFRHNDYWLSPEADPAPEWIDALRKALNLRLALEDVVWDPADTARMINARRETAR